jgi:hypothetical protein
MGHVKRQLVMWAAIATTAALLPGLALADNAGPDFGGHHGRGKEHGNTKLAIRGRALSRGEHDAYGMQIRGRSGDKPTDARGMVRFAQRGGDMAEGFVGRISCLSEDQAGIVTVTGTIKRGGTRASKGDKGKHGLKPGMGTAAMGDDDGTAMLDELAPWTADDAADLAADDAAAGPDDADTVAADPAPPSLPGTPSAPNMPPNKDPDKKHKNGGTLAGKDFAFTIDVPGNPQHFSQPKIADKGTLAACSGGGAPVAVTRGGFRTRDANGTKGEDGHRGRDGRRGDHHHGWWRR